MLKSLQIIESDTTAIAKGPESTSARAVGVIG